MESHESSWLGAFDDYIKRRARWKRADIAKRLRSESKRTVTKPLYLNELDGDRLLSVEDGYGVKYSAGDGMSVEVRNMDLADALDSLSSNDREIVLLAYALEWKGKEIAEWLSWKIGKVEYHKLKGLDNLKKILDRNVEADINGCR